MHGLKPCSDWKRLGGLLARQMIGSLAEYLARQMIEHDAAYAGSHYALALVAEQKKDSALALQEFAAAEKLWRNADADLPELQQTRARIAALKK